MSLFVCGPLGLTQKCGKLTILKTFLLALIRPVMLTWTKKQSLKAITKKNCYNCNTNICNNPILTKLKRQLANQNVFLEQKKSP